MTQDRMNMHLIHLRKLTGLSIAHMLIRSLLSFMPM